MLDLGRAQATQHTIAVLGEATEIAIELLIPVRKATQLSKVLDLIDEAGTHAAAIDFLQRHQIEIVDQIADFLQVACPAAMWQQMLPAARQVVVVALGTDTHLDIETEQTQPAVFRQAVLRQMMFVDLRIMQANDTGAALAPAAHGGRLLGGCSSRSLFGNQLIGNFQSLFRTSGRTQVKAVLAIDDHGRNASHLILLGQFLVLGDLALDCERVERFQEVFLVHALCGDEVSHVILVGQTLAAFLDGFEYGRVNLVLDAHGVEGDEQLAVCIPRAAEHGRDAYELDVERQFFNPRIDRWLERVAVRAAIPEQLDDFDLAWLGNRHSARQLDVLLARLDGRGSLGGHTEQTGGNQSGADDQITHALLLSRLNRLQATVVSTERESLSSFSVTLRL
ncbi:Uncharacterized protein ALO64_05504 [Pseudomonas meliae]|uniref:Uncharacterized protein n=1 Tax=Pseudomonas meliae TaxID=86176 RepID=A0A0P9UHT2_9PSED|nr:Uncharacterized protein ALO64_05504 [Pseudomonas meliae]